MLRLQSVCVQHSFQTLNWQNDQASHPIRADLVVFLLRSSVLYKSILESFHTEKAAKFCKYSDNGGQ